MNMLSRMVRVEERGWRRGDIHATQAILYSPTVDLLSRNLLPLAYPDMLELEPLKVNSDICSESELSSRELEKQVISREGLYTAEKYGHV